MAQKINLDQVRSNVKDFENAYLKVEEILRKADHEFAKMISDIKTLLRKNIGYSAEDLAKSLGIGRSTLFYRLKKYNVSLEEIRKAVIFEVYQSEMKRIKRREKRALPPASFDEFLQREVVQEVRKAMVSATITTRHMESTLRFWYNLCYELKLAPEDFIDAKEDKEKLEQIRKLILDWLSKKVEAGYDKRTLIAQLQTLQKWLEVQLLPSYIEQAEYKGKFQTAELPLELRELMVKKLIEKTRKSKRNHRKDYALALRAWIFLYYTGSRAESLTNFAVEGDLKVTWSEFVRVYGEDEFVIIRTEEKGKKGNKFTWRKLVPKSWAKYIPTRNLTQDELDKIRRITKEILMELLNERPDLFNQDTIKYVRDLSKTMHIWRHTFARDALRAFKWNRYLVAKLGGWVKDSNLQIYGDFDLISLIQEASKEHKMVFVSEETKKMIEEFLSEVER